MAKGALSDRIRYHASREDECQISRLIGDFERVVYAKAMSFKPFRVERTLVIDPPQGLSENAVLAILDFAKRFHAPVEVVSVGRDLPEEYGKRLGVRPRDRSVVGDWGAALRRASEGGYDVVILQRGPGDEMSRDVVRLVARADSTFYVIPPDVTVPYKNILVSVDPMKLQYSAVAITLAAMMASEDTNVELFYVADPDMIEYSRRVLEEHGIPGDNVDKMTDRAFRVMLKEALGYLKHRVRRCGGRAMVGSVVEETIKRARGLDRVLVISWCPPERSLLTELAQTLLERTSLPVFILKGRHLSGMGTAR